MVVAYCRGVLLLLSLLNWLPFFTLPPEKFCAIYGAQNATVSTDANTSVLVPSLLFRVQVVLESFGKVLNSSLALLKSRSTSVLLVGEGCFN